MDIDVDKVVAVITAVSLGFVGFQIFQANRLQRNQVEQDYLRRAFEAVHLPSLCLQDLAFAVEELHRNGTASQGGPPAYAEIAAAIATYRSALTRFASALQDAIVFGEAIDKVHGNAEYVDVFRVLRGANVHGFALQGLFGKVMRGELRVATLSADPLFEASVRASEVAANVLAEKIVRMYRLLDAQP